MLVVYRVLLHASASAFIVPTFDVWISCLEAASSLIGAVAWLGMETVARQTTEGGNVEHTGRMYCRHTTAQLRTAAQAL